MGSRGWSGSAARCPTECESVRPSRTRFEKVRAPSGQSATDSLVLRKSIRIAVGYGRLLGEGLSQRLRLSLVGGVASDGGSRGPSPYFAFRLGEGGFGFAGNSRNGSSDYCLFSIWKSCCLLFTALEGGASFR